MTAAGRTAWPTTYAAYAIQVMRSEQCAFCGREFRGPYPTKVRQRHEAEHRFAVIAKVATS